MRAVRIWVAAALLATAAAAACATDDFEEVEEDTDWTPDGKADVASGPLVVTEVGSDFVELRNDGRDPVDLVGWFVSFSTRRVTLAAHSDRPHVVEPGGLALLIDRDAAVPAGVPADVAVAAPSAGLVDLLKSKRIIVRLPSKAVADRVDARSPAAPGIAVDRKSATKFVLSAQGSTPGVRNPSHSATTIVDFAAQPWIQQQNPLPGELIARLGTAKQTIDAAIYQIDHVDVIAAFAAAARRGVRVRMVTDTFYFTDPDYVPGYQQMMTAGVSIVQDGRSARSHNKFVVIDGKTVWTGSFNPVQDDHGKFHADDVIVIESPALAAIHTAEFEEMFGGKFGPAKKDNGQHVAHADGATVEIYFAPTDGPKARILRAIQGAQHSIYFSAFAFYMPDIGGAMLARSRAGVDVRGVFDDTTANAQSQWAPLNAAGLDMRRPTFDSFLHYKFMILDYGTPEATVITGSYNLTDTADRANDESVVIIHDPYVARFYYEVWSRLYDRCAGPNTDTTNLAPLSISEVLVVPGADATARRGSFVELANLGDAAVALTGLSLRDREGSSLAVTGTVPPRGRLAIDTAGLDLDYGDPLVLVDGRSRVVSRFDQPSFAGVGLSLERADLTAQDLDAVWRPSAQAGGTPGR